MGSKEALGQMLGLCQAYLLLIANRELDADLRTKGGASDLVQETFLEAHRDFAQFHGGTQAEFVAWLRQLLLHNLANFRRCFRQTAKRCVAEESKLGSSDALQGPLAGLSSEEPSPSEHAMQNEQAAALENAMQRLPADYRQVLELRYRDGLPFEAIGRLMERSANAVEKLWLRAVERLRQELEADDSTGRIAG
jgi:RNA polymerase sigma-70 factor (ECF subfamily)